MKVAGIVAEALGDGVQKGHHIVPNPLFELGHAVRIDRGLAKAR